jgi:hypothetical protein
MESRTLITRGSSKISQVKKPRKSRHKSAALRFTFSGPLERLYRGVSRYVVIVPEEITKAIGKRGPVPILAKVNGKVEYQASLVPMGGGRHWLQLNGRARKALGLEPGHRVRVELEVPEKPPKPRISVELREILREHDLLKTFEEFPVGKQRHILEWVGRAAHENTREKRVLETIEVTQRAKDKAVRRAATAI